MATTMAEKETTNGQSEGNAHVKTSKDDEKSTEAQSQGGYFVSKLDSHRDAEAPDHATASLQLCGSSNLGIEHCRLHCSHRCWYSSSTDGLGVWRKFALYARVPDCNSCSGRNSSQPSPTSPSGPSRPHSIGLRSANLRTFTYRIDYELC
jgi:hypothetical protein